MPLSTYQSGTLTFTANVPAQLQLTDTDLNVFGQDLLARINAAGVVSFNTRAGAITMTLADVIGVTGTGATAGTRLGLAPVAASGAYSDLTGAPSTYSLPIATTAVLGGVKVDGTTITIASGVISAAGGGSAGVSTFNTRSGAVTMTLADVTGVGGAPLASPTFTGTPAVPTAAGGTSTTQIASTAFVMGAVGAGGGGTITGVTAGTGITGGGTTGTVTVNVSFGSSAPAAPGTASAGSATTASRSDHVHPLPTALPLANLAQGGATTGQVPAWNGTAYAPTTISGGGSSAFGTPQVIATSGTQVVDTTKALVVLNNTTGATNLTLANGTVDGQEIEIVILQTTQAHTLAATLNETSQTLGINSPNGGVSLNLRWSSNRTSWYPRSFDGGYKPTDYAAASALDGTELITAYQGTTDRKASAAQIKTFVGTGLTFTGPAGVTFAALTDAATITTNGSVNLGNVFTVTIAGNRTFSAPTNLPSGAYTYLIKQDGTGGRLPTFSGTVVWLGTGGAAPTFSTGANVTDAVSMLWNGTTAYMTFAKGS